MQYVQCKFRREDSRSYTYTYDGDELLAIDDEVKVPDPRTDDGWKRVYVAGFSDEAPAFACKAIIGRAEPEPAEPAVAPGLDLDEDEITF